MLHVLLVLGKLGFESPGHTMLLHKSKSLGNSMFVLIYYQVPHMQLIDSPMSTISMAIRNLDCSVVNCTHVTRSITEGSIVPH